MHSPKAGMSRQRAVLFVTLGRNRSIDSIFDKKTKPLIRKGVVGFF